MLKKMVFAGLLFAATFSGIPGVAPAPQAKALTYVPLVGPTYVFHVWYVCPQSGGWVYHSSYYDGKQALQTIDFLGCQGLTARYTWEQVQEEETQPQDDDE